MIRVRYQCCRHCEDPCPPQGHRYKCMECKTSASGKRAVAATGDWANLVAYVEGKS